MTWDVVYKKAINPDGTLLFPERLSKNFLDNARKTMGSILFANQYQNEVIPDEEKKFKKEWLSYIDAGDIPKNVYSFGFIDPAIGQKKNHDYTAITIVDVDTDGVWYVRVANRYRITPTEIVSKMFDICSAFKLMTLGVESEAFQEALLYFVSEEMKTRKITIPVTGIKQGGVSKDIRILGLVPRFEWRRLYVARGLLDFEDEYNSFPRASHDDILDALASIENIVHYPQRKEPKHERPNSAASPEYERWYIQELGKRAQRGEGAA